MAVAQLTNLETMNPQMQHCLNLLATCQAVCTETLGYGMQKGDDFADMTLMCSLRDCAEMSLMCTNMLIDGSEFMGRMFLIYAEMCKKCVMTCEGLSQDPQIAKCMEVCRECTEYCTTVGQMSSSYFRRPNLTTLDTLCPTA